MKHYKELLQEEMKLRDKERLTSLCNAISLVAKVAATANNYEEFTKFLKLTVDMLVDKINNL